MKERSGVQCLQSIPLWQNQQLQYLSCVYVVPTMTKHQMSILNFVQKVQETFILWNEKLKELEYGDKSLKP